MFTYVLLLCNQSLEILKLKKYGGYVGGKHAPYTITANDVRLLNVLMKSRANQCLSMSQLVQTANQNMSFIINVAIYM